VSWYRVAFATFSSYVIVSYLYGSVVATTLMAAVLVAAHLAGGYGTYLLGGVMGDFLGATICVTELLVLTLILLLTGFDNNNTNAPRTWEDALSFAKNLMATERQVVISIFMEHGTKSDHPVGVAVRFALLILVTVVWCCLVGHPNVLVQETDVRAPQDKEGKYVTNTEKKLSSRATAEAICTSLTASCQDRYDAVRNYLDDLAKPVGSLGTLEDWAARAAALQKTTNVVVDPVACLIFAADHGAAADPSAGGEGCSSYPQAVTQSVLQGLERGIAGASVLAKQNGVTELKVVDVGVVGNCFRKKENGSRQIVFSSPQKLDGGTGNLCTGAAMTAEEAERCVQIGRDEFSELVSDTGAKAVVLGEVGIGNTTASAALISHLAHVTVESVSGVGATTSRTVDKSVIEKKIKIVTKALKKHKKIESPMDALAKIGGAEIAALVGAILQASEQSIPILIDGLIATAAALVAASISPTSCRIMFLCTKSTEPGQNAAIAKIQELAEKNDVLAPTAPVLDMSLRMGEATGALMAVPLLRSAAAVLKSMGTIADILLGEGSGDHESTDGANGGKC